MTETVKIVLKGKEYPILFDLNIIEKIQKRYGKIEKIGEKIQEVSELKWILMTIINEGLDYEAFMLNQTVKQHLTEEQIGMLMSYKDLSSQEITGAIIKAFNDCLQDEKNV